MIYDERHLSNASEREKRNQRYPALVKKEDLFPSTLFATVIMEKDDIHTNYPDYGLPTPKRKGIEKDEVTADTTQISTRNKKAKKQPFQRKF